MTEVGSALLRGSDRICIVLLSGLGDVVMGLPIAGALKRHDPGIRITWVVEPMPAPILSAHPWVDQVVVYRSREGLRGLGALRKAMWRREFEVTLNFNVYLKSLWPTLLSGAPVRVGFGRDRARDGVWLGANWRLPPRARRHTVDMFRELPELLGVSTEPYHWELPLTESEEEERRSFRHRFDGRRIVAIVPASGNRKKDWLPERYAELADAVQSDFGARVVLVGGPGEREVSLAREIVDRASTPLGWAMGDGVRRLLWLIGGSDLVIAPDTGPVHIARALDVPVVGLYGHTNPWRVGPYRKFEDLWIDRYTEPGVEPDPGSWLPKLGRMEAIAVDDVLRKVERGLAS